ncbi:amidohydrolase family protein [Ruminococcaceae bacterium OttesenSCG-928-N02]|nr:amidohydrolase family protein [Ruminococcaceae bacterium OttesenSCG-928-N02]
MFVLYKNVNLYTPTPQGLCDVITWKDRVFQFGKDLTAPQGCEVVEGEGRILMPGIVDTHVHITGGGGEGGFTTRMSELTFEEAAAAGVTTVVGVLGTDGYARQPKEVLVKCLQMNEWGIETYMLTGSYTYPVVNIMGDVVQDIIYFEKCLGTGEFAIADHRSSSPTKEELRRVACDTRNAGRLAGKRGVLNIHLGNYEDGIPTLIELIKEDISLLPTFIPTHVNRRRVIFEQAKELHAMGGVIDLTAGMAGGEALTAMEALEVLYEKYGTLERVTCTSDACGSLPVYDKMGNLLSIDKGTSIVLINDLKALMERGKIPFETAILPFTLNGAQNYALKTSAGKIEVGGTANMVMLKEDYTIARTVLNGKTVYEG